MLAIYYSQPNSPKRLTFYRKAFFTDFSLSHRVQIHRLSSAVEFGKLSSSRIRNRLQSWSSEYSSKKEGFWSRRTSEKRMLAKTRYSRE